MPILIVSDAESSGVWSRPLTVLLVDDSPLIGEAVRRTLKGLPDLAYHFCSDGPRALEMAIELAPAVILLDLVMPDVDGLDLVVRFREEERTRNIPLVVLSTQEEPHIKAEAFRRGANDYIVKLPSEVELIARIRYHAQAYLNAERGRAAHAALRESQELLRQRNEEIQRQLDTVARQARELEAQNDYIRSRFGAGDVGLERRRPVSSMATVSAPSSPFRPDGPGVAAFGVAAPGGGESRQVAILAGSFRLPSAGERSGRGVEALSPEELLHWLGRYLGAVADAVAANGGLLLDDRGPDRMAALFAASPSDPAVSRALACGLSARRAIEALRATDGGAGLPVVEASFALHTGLLVVGDLGGVERGRRQGVGAALRDAYRLSCLAAPGQLLASRDALRRARLEGTSVEAREVPGLPAEAGGGSLAAREVVSGPDGG